MRLWAHAVLFLAFAYSAGAAPSLPSYSREELPNGVIVYLMPLRGTPLVSARVVVRGGAEEDPPGLAGLAALAGEMVRRGAGISGAPGFEQQLESLGATVDASIDAQSTTVAIETLASNAPRAIALIAGSVLRPAFPEEQVRKAVQDAVQASRAAKDSLGSASWHYLRSLYFGPRHPYARPFSGDELTLQRITAKDLRDYHARVWNGANLVAIVTGDFEPQAMRRQLADTFQSLPRGAPHQWSAGSTGRTARPGVLLIDKPESTQAWLRIALPGIGRTDPEREALALANCIFGGAFTSVLNERLRIDSGLTYEAYSTFDQDHLAGPIVISTYTDIARAPEMVTAVLDTLRAFHDGSVTAERLDGARAYLKGGFAADNLETSEQLAAVLQDLELNGLTRDEIDGLFARYDAVTLPRVNAIVKRYFGTDRISAVLAGRAADLRAAARRFAAPVFEVSIREPGYEFPGDVPRPLSATRRDRPAAIARRRARAAPR